jgi:hypothetical protein
MIDLRLLFALLQAAFYGLPLALIIVAANIYRRSRAQAAVLVLLAVAPFAYYAYCYVNERILAPLTRDEEVASWPRKPVTNDDLPKTIVTTAGWWVAKALVGAGPFQRAYASTPQGWLVYERKADPACPSPDESKRPPREAERLVSTRCVIAATAAGPALRERHLRLLTDAHAPSRHRASDETVSDATLELRWSDGTADELVAFWEIPCFRAVTFPPVWIGPKGFWRDLYAPRRYEPRPDPKTFVLNALRLGNSPAS